MKDLLLSNPLYLAAAVLVVLVVATVLWKMVKGAARLALILVLLALIAAAVVWLKGMGPLGG